MRSPFGVIDLFAGPGGLGEGFASLQESGNQPFRIEASIENDPSANRTLKLRAFLREYRSLNGCLPSEYLAFHSGRTSEPDWAEVDDGAWSHAESEACTAELGTDAGTEAVDARIAQVRNRYDDSVLIGGPPCQAYSLVGRARVRAIKGYKPEDDSRYFLYREYLRVLHKLRPAAFVMENVKGMLSATVRNRAVFEMFAEELRSPDKEGERAHYELHALRASESGLTLEQTDEPRDFVVRCEEFGVPQRRHRVIIVGLRNDVAHRIRVAPHSRNFGIQPSRESPSVWNALHNLPPLRSGLSRGHDTTDNWISVVFQAAKTLRRLSKKVRYRDLNPTLDCFDAEFVETAKDFRRSSASLPTGYGHATSDLMRWLEDPKLTALAQHETRAHMPPDVQRYLFAAVHGAARGRSPKASDFPPELAPRHRNWDSGVFSDRFRVQIADQPATTVTSHIAKDGHYFIHPAWHQCRSLTVREAARLQTFPDDYVFLGNRTQQYVQVGNAVPPYLAQQIAKLVWRAFAA